ncbi:MAG: Gfo/Idh/MocA family oxidoreductase [Anaerolineales bacterium]|nr:Gfo/Idh/MocA family oxidoreductase [Anaerolineales bacterium]
MSPGTIRAVLIGAGQRGALSYAPYALQFPEELEFVAVAEPDAKRRATFAAQHNIPQDKQFESWEPLLENPAVGEAVVIATQDWQHTAPAVAAMRAGYHVLLEKPMATTAEDCRLLYGTSAETGRQLFICHVLRYTPHFLKMRELVQSGVLGRIVQVSHRENVSFWHMAHSYVRGNWANSEQSSPMILAKCCHDLDILPWILGQNPVQLASTGSLMHFRPENAPEGAPARCLEGCPAEDVCPYFAPFIYQDMAPFWNSFADTSRGFHRWAARTYIHYPNLIQALSLVVPALRQLTHYEGWPLSVLAQDPAPENIEAALRDGPYGRCVYHCGSDVVDQQVVLMQMEDGAPVTLTMHGHSHNEVRTTRIEGSEGRLMAEFGPGGSRITLDEHRTDWHMEFDTSAGAGSGHGGGDLRLVAAFLDSLRRGDTEAALQGTREALQAHLLAFAAEESRLSGGFVSSETWGT